MTTTGAPRRLLLAVTTLVTVMASVLTGPSAAPALTLKQVADGYMIEAQSAFTAHRVAAPAPFDWSSDGCSVVPDRPAGFDFLTPCRRHDFGYRNYGGTRLRLDRTEGRRGWVDGRFYADMGAVCGRQFLPLRPLCYSFAWSYYVGVRLGGSGAFFH